MEMEGTLVFFGWEWARDTDVGLVSKYSGSPKTALFSFPFHSPQKTVVWPSHPSLRLGDFPGAEKKKEERKDGERCVRKTRSASAAHPPPGRNDA